MEQSEILPLETEENASSYTENLEITDLIELQNNEAGQKVARICAGVDELKALDIMVLDVRKQTIIADYFVICSGTSSTHIRSIAGNVQDRMREGGFRSKPEGDGDSQWVVMDYGDAILHVLSEETREFYDLERLWADAKMTQWPESQPSG
ncbi:ribosome-associated protein [Abditibacterium utsteinense]|uniref:Ribosomal silencing factor RsfS n=1 Tax=Abditibacterium utsteinense TaxID=1960156 RepID=A0A2S8SUF9_9BACT|nr:ribosome silencing factor [Abditibacterium utsteinense]PQV64430.1 ribosome-associated protein [Abditibacterium utsteinense]